MTTCVVCEKYFKQSPWNNTNTCYSCYDDVDELPPEIDQEDQLEVDLLMNPSGHTKGLFYE
jgi:hypothetical protein